jgi:chaperonin GroES
MKPFPKYCLVEPIEDENVSAGGVYLPENTQDKPMKGKVIAVGSKVKNVKVGDIIVHRKWINETYTHKGKEYLFVRSVDMLAKL